MYSRWLVFSSCTLIAGITGLTTAFGLISPALETHLNLNAADLALIGAIGNVGSFSGFFSGILIDYIGVKYAIYFASTIVFIGLFGIWLSIEEYIPADTGSICILIYFCQFGAATVSQGTSSTSILIFPVESVGQVAGLSKAYYGIAGAVLSAVAGSYFLNAKNGFILFASIFMSITIGFGGFFCNLIPTHLLHFTYESQHDIRHDLTPYFYHLLGLILWIILFAALDISNLSKSSSLSLIVATIIIIWQLSVVFIPFISYKGFMKYPLQETQVTVSNLPTIESSVSRPSLIQSALIPTSQLSMAADMNDLLRVTSKHQISEMRPSVISLASNNNGNTPLLPTSHRETGQDDCLSSPSLSNAPQLASAGITLQQDLNTLEMVSTVRFHCIFLFQAAHYGAVLLVINLIAKVAGSFGVPPAAYLVLLISLGSAFGRVAIGHLTKTPSCAASGFLNLLYSAYIPSIALFCFMVFWTGTLYGAMAVAAAAGVVQMFGVTHVAKNDGMFDLSSAVGSLGIAFGLIATFPPPTTTDDDEITCEGAQCYQKALLVSGCLALCASVGAVLLDVYMQRYPPTRS